MNLSDKFTNINTAVTIISVILGLIGLVTWFRRPKIKVRGRRTTARAPIVLLDPAWTPKVFDIIEVTVSNEGTVPIYIRNVTAEFKDGSIHEIADEGSAGKLLQEGQAAEYALSPAEMKGRTLKRFAVKTLTGKVFRGLLR